MTNMYTARLGDEEKREMDIYLDRFQSVPPQDLLRYMGQMRDFFYKYMTPEGKKFFEQSRLETKLYHD